MISIRVISIFAASATLALLISGSWGAITLATAQSLEVRDGRVFDRPEQISVSVLEGWTLDQDSHSGNLVLARQESGASFTITSTASTGESIELEFKAFKSGMFFGGGSWTFIGERWLSISGDRAGQVEGVRTIGTQATIHEWTTVVDRLKRTYILAYRVHEPPGPHEYLQVKALLKSIHWLPKPRQ